MTTLYKEIKEQFLKNVSTHRIKVIHDYGLFKHIRFERPDLLTHWFELVTWGECLTINGDMGTYTFSYNNNMFGLFRNKNLNINPVYFSEKLKSTCSLNNHLKFSLKEFKYCVEENFKGWDFSEEEEANEYWSDIEDRILCSETEEEAITSIFLWNCNLANQSCDYTFDDLNYMNLKEFTYHYIWCLYAISWGIQQYDEFLDTPCRG